MASSGFMTLKFPNTSHPFSKATDGDCSNKTQALKVEPPRTSLQATATSTTSMTITTSTTSTTGMTSTNVVKQTKKWRCDFCKNRVFEDFDEACAHEARCEKRMKERKAKKQAQKRLVEQQQLQKQAQENEQMKKQQQQIEQQQRQQQQQQQRQAQQKTQLQAMKKTVQLQSSKKHSQEEEMRKQLKRNEEKQRHNKQKQEQKPLQLAPKAQKQKQKPKQEQNKESRPKAAASTAAPTHCFFAPRKPGAATSKKRSTCGMANNFFQPRTGKKQKGIVSSSQSSAFSSQGSMTIEILDDLPPSSTPQPAMPTTRSGGEVQFVGSKQPTKPRKRSRQGEVTVDNAHNVANALAAMINRQSSPTSSQSSSSTSSNINAPIAGIFGSKPTKELIAEQRQAEFQAKRRLERQKELERQQKRRQAQPLARSSKPKSSSSTATSPKLPLAPRFPVPSHIRETPDVLDPVHICVGDEWKRSMDTATDSSSSNDVVSQAVKKIVSSPSALDCFVDSSEDTITHALHQVLLPPGKSLDKLLVDQYSSNLVGDSMQQIKLDLTKWVRGWGNVREEAWKRMMERQRKLAKRPKAKKKKKKAATSDDYDEWLGLEDDPGFDGELGNLVLLTGASGSGKTALVHQVASECQCPVLEINTTQARGGAALKHAIQEATQSCSSLEMIQRQSRKLSPFGEESDDEGNDGEDSKKSSQLTVILIDEVDFLFEEHGDAGFWNALATLTKTAKCPIFVTANKMPPQMNQLQRFHHWNLLMPSPGECMTKLLQVCRQEGISMRPDLNREEIKSRLAHVAELCGCDVRRMLNELQSFCYPIPKLTKDECNPKDKRDSAADASDIQWSASMQLPQMDSLNPNKISRKKHSIVTIHGKNFNSLLRFKGEWSILLGETACKAHVVDGENLLILCPPQTQESRSFEPISIQLSNGGAISCNSVETLDLPGGLKFNGRKFVWLQYEDADLAQEADDDEEIEFETNEAGRLKEESKVSVASKEETEEDKSALGSWKSITTLQDADKKASVEPNSTSQDDHLAALKKIAETAYDMSDAALLEDLQHGVPFLSGACPGYGFDLTDGAECEKGKMKMSEQLRPPREEKLYELGWKDNCCFFGNSETYMVLPTTAAERRSINSEMVYSKGYGYHVAAPAPSETKEEGEDEIDIEELVTETLHSMSEDNYLPQQTSSLVLSLPSLIRQGVGRKFTACLSFNESVFNTSRNQRLLEAQELTAYMKGLERQQKTHVMSPFVAENKTNSAYVLELLPMLRRVSVLERDSEQIDSVPTEDSSRRSTRTRSRRGRRHYFEKLGFCEAQGQDLTASKAGQSFARSFLVYDKPEKTTGASAKQSR